MRGTLLPYGDFDEAPYWYTVPGGTRIKFALLHMSDSEDHLPTPAELWDAVMAFRRRHPWSVYARNRRSGYRRPFRARSIQGRGTYWRRRATAYRSGRFVHRGAWISNKRRRLW